MAECASADTKNFEGEIPVIQPAYSDFYFGLWPDDYYFPVKTSPELLSDETANKLFCFLTEHVASQAVLPDRVEESGHCVFQPGREDSPHGRLMPMHLPAAWARLVSYLYERAAKLFQTALPERAIVWQKCAVGIAENIWRLQSDEGWFLSDSVGCRQFSAWPNGLIYGEDYLSKETKEQIRAKIWAERETLICRGMTRQNADSKWKQMNPVWPFSTGVYMDGGYWAVGTGYILRCLADLDENFARRTVEEMIDSLSAMDFPEWMDAKGERFGGKKFMMSLAIPLAAVRAIENDSQLVELF